MNTEDKNIEDKKTWIIGLCDDAQVWRLHCEHVLSDFLGEEGETADFLCFPDAASLLANQQEMDVLFLDIRLDAEPDGIWLAEHLNKKQRNCQIVYLTNYLSYAVDVYRTKHCYFVLKEQFSQRLGDIFGKLRACRQQELLCFSTLNGGTLVLHPGEIHYFERVLRTTKIITDTGTYLIRDKMDALEKILPEQEMLRCHNSYIVNLAYVREMYKGCFLLKDHTSIQISRSYARPVKEKFIRWARGQIGEIGGKE